MISRRNFLRSVAAGSALTAIGKGSEGKAAILNVIPDSGYCYESKRKIPVIAETDVLVVGGSSAAVAAAVAAAKGGKKVFLIGYMPYLGDDICGAFQYSLEEDEHPTCDFDLGLKPQPELVRKVYAYYTTPLPLYVKTVFDSELIDNNIDFLYSSYVTNVLTDENNQCGGVVIANRSGRQIIKCKALIDATHTADVARMCNVGFTRFTPGKERFCFTVVGNKNKEVEGAIDSETIKYKIRFRDKDYHATQYTFEFPVKNMAYSTFMSIEQTIRDKTWDADQVDSSDLLWYIPSVHIKSEGEYSGEFKGVRRVPVESFIPKGQKNVFVLGPCADVSRDVARKLFRPVQAMAIGEIVGDYVANNLSYEVQAGTLSVKYPSVNASNYGKIGETLQHPRPLLTSDYIESSHGVLPILGKYDVVVAGGGTAGATAGISSAQHGAKTLILEYLHGLGGMTTMGLIGCYWDGFREGYTKIIDKGVREMAPLGHPRQKKKWQEQSPSDWKMEWFRQQARKNQAEIWFGIIVCGALYENNRVKGLVVATPTGRGVILSDLIIDSTGSADVAIAAGAPYEYTGLKTIAVQGSGLPYRNPDDFYNNSDWAFVDDTDIIDVSRIFVQGKKMHQSRYDMGKLPQTRERRRIIGEHIISVYDVINQRRYSDTISYHMSSFDTHGMIIDPYFVLSPPEIQHTKYDADVPLRSLLPKGMHGIIVTGLGASAHRDAMPVIRMQPCLQNQGFAVGYLAALSIKEKKDIRKIDIKKVQRYLVGMGNLPERVLKDKDFDRFSSKDMSNAAKSVADNFKGLEVLLTQPENCARLMEKEMAKATTPEAKVIYSTILCFLGNKKYAKILSDKIESEKRWDAGWYFKAGGQFGTCVSPLDARITALGKAGDKAYLSTIIEKGKLLIPEDYFSHYRAIAESCESIGDSDAVPLLYELLTQPGMRYHYILNYRNALNNAIPHPVPSIVAQREKALKELLLARALFMCGDKNNLGKSTLEYYAKGLEAHYARFATEILAARKGI